MLTLPHGGQRRAAEQLLAADADVNAFPDYAGNQTALDQAVAPDTRRSLLATWLRENGATVSLRLPTVE